MSSAATAVAPTKVNNKDIIISLVPKHLRYPFYLAFTAMADLALCSEARIVNKIDKTIVYLRLS
jgi:hypothetical protein